MNRARSGDLAIALAWGFCFSVGAYAASRAFAALTSQAPTAASLAAPVWSVHSGFVWRAMTASYAGGMVTFVVLALARSLARWFADALVLVLVASATLLALQAALWP
jgi:hypothetical protein